MELLNKRSSKILAVLIESQKPITGDQLSTLMTVSTRTIRNDIKGLNSTLKKYSIQIDSKIGEGYYLQNNYIEKVKNILDYSQEKKDERIITNIIPSNPQDRANYLLTRLLTSSLNKNEIINFFDLADELFIGTSTLKKDLLNVANILHKYNLRISNTQKHGVRIVGNEAGIRYCISQYVFNNTNNVSFEDNPLYGKFFEKEKVDLLKDIVEKNIYSSSIRLTDLAFKNLVIHILIMLKRSEKEAIISYKDDELERLRKTPEYYCSKKIADELDLQMNVVLGNETYYITQLLLTSQRFHASGSDYHSFEGTQCILQAIQEKTGIDFLDDELLILSLDTHLNTALQRIRFKMNIRNDVLDIIKKTYPLAFELAVLAGKVINDTYHIEMMESEIGFIAMHFALALERKGLNSTSEPKKLIIVCGSAAVTAMLMKEKIKQLFSDRIQIVKLSPVSDLTQELIDSVDLVLSTVPLQKYESSKIKYVKSFLDNYDIRTISRAIDDSSNDCIDFKKIIRKDLFFTDLHFKTRDQVLEFLTDQMLKKNYISTSVKESIFEREKMATTELGGLVAIPHALLNEMEDASIAIAVLQKPILWEEEKVQVVLLLNIPKTKKSLWEIVFKRLYQILIDGQGVVNLISNRDYKMFINELEKDEVN